MPASARLFERVAALLQPDGGDTDANADVEAATRAAVAEVVDDGELAGVLGELPAHGHTRVNLLHLAASRGALSLVKLLLERGVPVDGKDGEGLTALHYACKDGRLAVVRYLTEMAGADTGARTAKLGSSIHWAACGNHCDVIEYVLQHGADAEWLDYKGRTALDSAIVLKCGDAIRLLAKLGCPCRTERLPEPDS